LSQQELLSNGEDMAMDAGEDGGKTTDLENKEEEKYVCISDKKSSLFNPPHHYEVAIIQ
jgi:hypothetical protein